MEYPFKAKRIYLNNTRGDQVTTTSIGLRSSSFQNQEYKGNLQGEEYFSHVHK